MSVRVRRAALADAEAIAPLFDAYRVFYDMPAAPAASLAFLRDRLAQDDSAIFVAEAAGGIAGFTQLYPSFSSTKLGRLWILNDLYVRPDARRGGAGNALMETAEQFARSSGAIGVMLSTAHENAVAQSVYVKRGYVHDAGFRDYYKYF